MRDKDKLGGLASLAVMNVYYGIRCRCGSIQVDFEAQIDLPPSRHHHSGSYLDVFFPSLLSQRSINIKWTTANLFLTSWKRELSRAAD